MALVTMLSVFFCLLVFAVKTRACAASSAKGAAEPCTKVCECRSYFQLGPTGGPAPANQEMVNMLKAIKEEFSQATKDLRAEMKQLRDRCTASPAADCSDLRKRGTLKSGVYEIYPFGVSYSKPIKVYCDMETDGGGWTIFQRRLDGSTDFYRSWAEYKQGFGDVSGEYWLGNDVINKLSTAKPLELRLDMEDWAGKKGFAKYNEFSLSNSAAKYKLHVAGYSGTAGDGLAYHNGQPFSTKDADNDAHGSHCAVVYHGAWWYKACHYSNLNGRYYRTGTKIAKADGVDWRLLNGYHNSLKIVNMKVRPREFKP